MDMTGAACECADFAAVASLFLVDIQAHHYVIADEK